MPFPFVLPTTSNFSFSSAFASDSHPSLPLTASTYRGVLRDHLKKHKRLPPTSQSANLPTIVASITAYLPYLLTLDAGLRGTNDPQDAHGAVRVTSQTAPSIEWRPTLSDSGIPGREPQRVKIEDLRHEVAFVLLTLGSAETLLSRAALHPLYVTSAASVGTQQRTTAIQSATRNLLDASSIYAHAASLAENATSSTAAAALAPPCADLSPSTARALSSLALAEATLLAVLKDDPYPAVVAQDRNANDKEWMYKSPDIPKVRAHLFARLCLAAGEHAARASSLLQSCRPGAVDAGLARYAEDLRRASRAKACRFFGVDAELGGQVGEAIAWLDAGLQELGVEKRGDDGRKRSFGLGRMRKEWSEKREDKKVERETDWGGDAGKLEETRVIEMLSEKWNKVNDTVNTQVVPPPGPLLAKMPTGREIHAIPIFRPPSLEAGVLDSMRAPPDRADAYGDAPSSDDDEGPSRAGVGAFPGSGDYSRSSSAGYY